MLIFKELSMAIVKYFLLLLLIVMNAACLSNYDYTGGFVRSFNECMIFKRSSELENRIASEIFSDLEAVQTIKICTYEFHKQVHILSDLRSRFKVTYYLQEEIVKNSVSGSWQFTESTYPKVFMCTELDNCIHHDSVFFVETEGISFGGYLDVVKSLKSLPSSILCLDKDKYVKTQNVIWQELCQTVDSNVNDKHLPIYKLGFTRYATGSKDLYFYALFKTNAGDYYQLSFDINSDELIILGFVEITYE